MVSPTGGWIRAKRAGEGIETHGNRIPSRFRGGRQRKVDRWVVGPPTAKGAFPADSLPMSPLHRSLLDILSIQLNQDALTRLEWRDFPNGLRMARLAKEGEAELVLYRIESAQPLVFLRHEHVGGEGYLVLSGSVEDEFGTYHAGDYVYLDQGSIHRPRAEGGTVILVLWPKGVRVVE